MLLGLPSNLFFLQMNMARKFHNQRLQTDPRLHDEGTQNTDSHTPLKQSNQLSSQQDDCRTIKGIKNNIWKQGANTNSHRQWEQQQKVSTIPTAFQ